MSLTAAMETARQSLSVISAKTSVVSRNVSNASLPFASRKLVNSYSGFGGTGVILGGITRVSDEGLLRALLSSNSNMAYQQARVTALDQLNATIGDPELDASPAALIGKLADAVQQYAAAPGDLTRGQAAISAAEDVAQALNTATRTVQDARSEADSGIAASAEKIRTLLSQFEEVNNDIIRGTVSGSDITDSLDTRDSILSNLSQEIGIRTVAQNNNSLSIYTETGQTLFNGTPRTITFTASPVLAAGQQGNDLLIDGQAVLGPGAATPLTTGRLAGYAEIRDNTAVKYQNQLDEMARGLIELFRETDQSGGGGAAVVGLFTYDGLTSPATVPPAVPPAGTLGAGLAGQIKVNANFAADPTYLRDGETYDYNASNSSGFSGRLDSLYDGFNALRSFDSQSDLIAAGTTVSVLTFSSYSAGWLEAIRSTAESKLEYNYAVQTQAQDSLSKVTGVNLDYEMSILLELEHSYQATSRIISTIDNMYAALLSAVG